MNKLCFAVCSLGCFWATGMAMPLLAAGPPVVDVVALKSGKSLRGAVLDRQPDGSLLVAVSRSWLEQVDLKEFTRQAARQTERQLAAWEQAVHRLELLLANPPGGPRLVFFVKQELRRLEKQRAAPPGAEPLFILMDVPATQVAKLVPAPLEWQRIAQFAWKEGLPRVETRDGPTLRKELIAAGIDVDGPPPDLSDQIPVRPQSEEEWAARWAIVRYTLSEPLDFQGMGDTLVRTGDGEPVNLAAILPKLLSSQVDSLLGDLLPTGPKKKSTIDTSRNSLKPAITIAEQARQPGFRVTRLDLQAERRAVAVRTEFVAQLREEKWQTIWMHTETADGSQARPEAEAKIAQDPQVKGVLISLRGLGTEDAVTDAIRIGAATMSAQQAADARFFDFRDRYSRRVDGPVLLWARE